MCSSASARARSTVFVGVLLGGLTRLLDVRVGLLLRLGHAGRDQLPLLGLDVVEIGAAPFSDLLGLGGLPFGLQGRVDRFVLRLLGLGSGGAGALQAQLHGVAHRQRVHHARAGLPGEVEQAVARCISGSRRDRARIHGTAALRISHVVLLGRSFTPVPSAFVSRLTG